MLKYTKYINIQYCSTEDIIADALIKPLPLEKIEGSQHKKINLLGPVH